MKRSPELYCTYRPHFTASAEPALYLVNASPSVSLHNLRQPFPWSSLCPLAAGAMNFSLPSSKVLLVLLRNLSAKQTNTGDHIISLASSDLNKKKKTSTASRKPDRNLGKAILFHTMAKLLMCCGRLAFPNPHPEANFSCCCYFPWQVKCPCVDNNRFLFPLLPVITRQFPPPTT